jgi:F420H2 dehydrogenase subunit J
MSEKSGVNVIKSIFNLVIILLALGIVFGGAALVVLFSPWAKVIAERLIALDIKFVIQLFSFAVVAGIITLLSVLVVYSKNIVHSGLYLLGCFAGVAGLYMFLNAPFLGVSQVLVYIGAVGVLLLFAVMLTRKTIVEEEVHGEL